VGAACGLLLVWLSAVVRLPWQDHAIEWRIGPAVLVVASYAAIVAMSIVVSRDVRRAAASGRNPTRRLSVAAGIIVGLAITFCLEANRVERSWTYLPWFVFSSLVQVLWWIAVCLATSFATADRLAKQYAAARVSEPGREAAAPAQDRSPLA
jgi:hypothetical protein